MSERPFGTYFEKHRRDAVLLHRPYPPHAGAPTNSKFGGLPKLPQQHDWPRDANGGALHFLAQIDCADITFETLLPERGVLFFFASDDGQQLWDADGVPGSARVIYELDAFAKTPPRAHPNDLGPIGGGYRPRSFRGLVLAGEEGPKVHVEWPIQPLKIDTWPGALFGDEPAAGGGWLAKWADAIHRAPEPWKKEEARQRAYADAHHRLRYDAFSRAVCEPLEEYQDALRPWRTPARTIFEHADFGSEAFPFFCVNIRHAARHLIWDLEQNSGQSCIDEVQMPVAHDWLSRAEEQTDDGVPSDSERAEFRAWLMRWHKQRPDVPPDELRYSEAVFQAMRTNILTWSGDPRLAARIPPQVYAVMRACFDSRRCGGVVYSQLLGHAPSAQEPLHSDEPMLCLLNLCSDPVLGTMYGDVDNATFYISPKDLVKRDFSRVEAKLLG